MKQNLRLRIPFACLALFPLFAGISGRALAQDTKTQTVQAVQPGVLWLLDLGLGQGYDDNAIGTGQGGYFAEFDPTLDLRQYHEHGFWSFDFQPTIRRFYNFSAGDRIDEQASTKDSWQMSRRWTWDLSGNYLHTNDPFAVSESASGAQPVGGVGVVAPNNSFIGPESPFTVFDGSSTLHYQVGRRTELTFGGDYFTNRENAPGLPNTASHAFRAGYTKMVRRGQTVGLLYSAQFFNVNNPEQQVTTNSLLLSYDFEWKTGRQIALFAGPQYSLLNANSITATALSPALAAVNQDLLGYAAGATLSLLVTKQNYFQLMASRRVADGAGVSGAVIQDEAQLGLSRRFSKRLSASVGGFYSEYQPLGDLPVVAPNTWGAFNRAEFAIAPRSSFSVEYDYFHQTQISTSLAPLFSHNRVLIEYHYSFGALPGSR
ncbi:MAG: hypothetical protein WAN33_12085 [Candidatus Acidiferrales bacterium]